MARITVEDCLEQVPSRFDLVHMAAKRARRLSLSGEEPMVPWDQDKSTVVALREIAEGFTEFNSQGGIGSDEISPEDFFITEEEPLTTSEETAEDNGTTAETDADVETETENKTASTDES